jgi:hypothetical protein
VRFEEGIVRTVGYYQNMAIPVVSKPQRENMSIKKLKEWSIQKIALDNKD